MSDNVEQQLRSLAGRRVTAVAAEHARVSVTFVFDDGSELEVNAGTEFDVGVLEYEFRGPKEAQDFT